MGCGSAGGGLVSENSNEPQAAGDLLIVTTTNCGFVNSGLMAMDVKRFTIKRPARPPVKAPVNRRCQKSSRRVSEKFRKSSCGLKSVMRGLFLLRNAHRGLICWEIEWCGMRQIFELLLFDSDPRLHPISLGNRRKNGRVSVEVSVAGLPGYNPRQPRPLLADELGSSWFMFTT
jgi:hypothetical protein